MRDLWSTGVLAGQPLDGWAGRLVPVSTREPRLTSLVRAMVLAAAVVGLLDVAAVLAAQSLPDIVQQAYLKASNSKANDHFGGAVAASGDTIVVSASSGLHVFVRAGTSWSQQAHLQGVGSPFAVDGDTIVVGTASGNGTAYVLVRNGTNWSQQAVLQASNTESGDYFGWSVSIAGDTAVVGAPGEDSSATGVNGNQSDNSAETSGAAYVFVRTGTNWSQEAYLKGSNTEKADAFGISVSVSGDTVAVGALRESSNATGVNGDQSDNSFWSAGAAYVFVRTGTNWSQQAYIKASNTGETDDFAQSVSVSGDTLLVGAKDEDSNATGVNGDQNNNAASDAGAAYVFVRDGTTWEQQAYLKASNTEAGVYFGSNLSVFGDTIVVGVQGADSSGAAYVFQRMGTTWTQRAYLKASNAETSDSFGSVSVSNDTVVVGAPYEDSNASGVNGNQNDNSLNASGAVYVFYIPANPWEALGLGLAGVAGLPSLVGTGELLASTPVSLDLSNAKQFAPCYLVVGVSNLSAPFKGGVLVPYPNLLFGQTVDFFGEASFGGLWPPGIPSGFTVYFQYWIVDAAGPFGFAASNAISGTTP